MGLAGWGRDLPGHLGQLAQRLGAASAQGKSLTQALAEERTAIPPAYAAVVDAGLRSGRLPSALESVSHSMRSVREARNAVGLAVSYPLIVILLAYALFAVLMLVWVPSLLSIYESHPPRFLRFLSDGVVWLWTPMHLPALDIPLIPPAVIPPAVLVALAAIWWRRSSQAMVVDAATAQRWLGWLPVAPRVARHSRLAALAEILGMLIEQDVPVQDAIVLAADCTGDTRLMHAAQEVSAAIVRGAPPEQYRQFLSDFPPLLSWLTVTQARQPTLAALARHCADTYRRRIARETQWLRDFLPIWLIAVVGGVVVLAYALSIFVPFTRLLEDLGNVGPTLRIRP
jgi:general secretion pathway protein F